MRLTIGEEQRVGDACQSVAEQWDFTTSLKENTQPLRHIPTSSLGRVGKLLGCGKFCEVREIKSRKSMGPLAVKELRKSVKLDGAEDFLLGAIDLVHEAKLLNSLNHKNIIRLHGVSCPQDSLSSSYEKGKNFRLYLDRLHSTVEDKLVAWDDLPPSIVKRDLGKRIAGIALPVARAMSYLHSNNIIYRDLKPKNMGFTKEGTLKLFDFGFARELLPDSDHRLTGQIGTPVYMAPEVALSKHYGLKADVYSFGIVLFELCTLEICYDERMTPEKLYRRVIKGNTRPRVSDHSMLLSPQLRQLMEDCWSKSPTVRPDFERVVTLLEKELQSLRQVPATNKNSTAAVAVKAPSVAARRTTGTKIPSTAKTMGTKTADHARPPLKVRNYKRSSAKVYVAEYEA